MKKVIILLFAVFEMNHIAAQNLTKINDTTFGGQNNDESIFTFRDTLGNIYTFGTISQSSVPMDLTVQYGGQDYSVVKYDKNGNKVWNNAYGGADNDVLYKVIPKPTGFLLIGISFSSNSGNKTSSVNCTNPFPTGLVNYTREVWIVEIDFDGSISNQNGLCTSWTFGSSYSNPDIEQITDFRQISNGDYILCGNFVSYRGASGANYDLGNFMAYVRMDSSFNYISATVLLGSDYIAVAGQIVSYVEAYNGYGGQVVELPNHDLLFSYTLENIYNRIPCGDNSANGYTYAMTSLYSSFDVRQSTLSYGSHYGFSRAKKLMYYNNNVYLFMEHIPLPANTVDYYTSCSYGSFYLRTTPARTISNKKDCWIVKLSATMVPEGEYAFGANDDITVGDVVLDNNNNFILGMNVNSGPGFDKTSSGKGGQDYWILRINSGSMTAVADYCYGGSNDDLLTNAAYYQDVILLTGNSYSDSGLDKTGANRAGTVKTTDQWTVVLCQNPSPPLIENVDGFNILLTCKGDMTTLNILNPIAGYTYNWYEDETGPSFYTGTSYTTGSTLVLTTYYVDQNNGYCGSSRYGFNLIPVPVPNPPVISQDTVICKGGTLLLTAHMDTTGMKGYIGVNRWYNSDGTGLIHTGDTLRLANIMSNRTIYVSTVDSVYYPTLDIGPFACESAKELKMALVDSGQLPVISMPSYYCYGTDISLSLSNKLPASRAEWYDSKNDLIATSAMLVLDKVQQNDTISVIQTTQYGCTSPEKTVIVNVEKDSTQMPQIALMAGYCIGSTIALESSYPPNAEIDWYTADRTFLYSGNPYVINAIQKNDTLFTSSVGADGCISPQKELIVMATRPAAAFNAAKTSIHPGDAVHFINASSGAAPVSYYWDFGDADFSTELSPWHYFNAPGFYAIKLVATDVNTCTDTLFKPAYIQVDDYVGIQELSAETGILIFPNPFKENLTIESRNVNEFFQIRLMDVLGQVIHSENLAESQTLNTSDLVPGFYFIEFKNDRITRSVKLIKN